MSFSKSLKYNKIKLSILGALFLVLGLFPTSSTLAATNVFAACDTDLNGKSNAELQDLLQRCQAEIDAQTALLKQTQQQTTSIKQGITELNQKITKSELEIKARTIKIAQLSDVIKAKSNRIGELTSKMDDMRASLSELFRKINQYDAVTPVEALLTNKNLATFFAESDSLDVLKRELYSTLLEVKQIKAETETERAVLEQKQREENAAKFEREQEKRKALTYKSEREVVLKMSLSQESQYKKDIAAKEAKKNEIRSRMLRTVGGTEIKFGDALKVIQPFESTTGVEAALVLAVLTQESSVNGVIGSNIGKCTYNQPASNQSGTVMSNSQKPAFLSIMSELGLDPNSQQVSCPIRADGQYGGAMGPSQFMPITWLGYRDRIASIAGVTVPSPFRNLDAFLGTALYLSDAQGICRSSFSSQQDIWACAAAKYYSGLKSSGATLRRHMAPPYSYGYRVAVRAAQFQRDIDTLNN